VHLLSSEKTVAFRRFLEHLHLTFCRQERVQGQYMHGLVGVCLQTWQKAWTTARGTRTMRRRSNPMSTAKTTTPSRVAEVDLLRLEVISDLHSTRQFGVQRAVELGVVAIRTRSSRSSSDSRKSSDRERSPNARSAFAEQPLRSLPSPRSTSSVSRSSPISTRPANLASSARSSSVLAEGVDDGAWDEDDEEALESDVDGEDDDTFKGIDIRRRWWRQPPNGGLPAVPGTPASDVLSARASTGVPNIKYVVDTGRAKEVRERCISSRPRNRL
jgi:hypothetical protein